MDKQREAFEAWLKREYPNRTDGYIEWHDVAGEYSLDEVQFAFEAWKAAKGHDNHIGDVNEMVQAKPVARIKTMGGYPDDSRHELELLVKHGQLSDGQLLYAAQPPAVAVAVPDGWRDAAHAAVIGLGAVRTSIERGETDKALARVNEVRAMLAAAQKDPRQAFEEFYLGRPFAVAPTCQTCSGHGMIGGLLPNGGGYYGEPCPDCNAPQPTAEDSSGVQADAPAPATEYSWSNNGEEYHGRFSSVADAVCDYLDSEGGDAEETVHVGEVKPHEPGNPIRLADNVLETLGVQAHDEVGECVEDWPQLPPEKREQLGKMIQDFVWTHDAPRFFSIGKSELVEVAPYRDDAAAQKGGK